MHRTGNPAPIEDISGFFMATHASTPIEILENQDETFETTDKLQVCNPFIIKIENETFIPVFSTVEKLEETLKLCGIDPEQIQIKKIEDGFEFLLSVGEFYPVAADPWIAEEGRTRFTMFDLRDAIKEAKENVNNT